MSEDRKLEMWKKRRLREMHRAMLSKKIEEEKNKTKKAENGETSTKDALKKILKGRAWEVLEIARNQFPRETAGIERELASLVLSGEMKESITGEQLLWFFRTIGLNIKMDVKIRVLENGKLKTISEKIKGKQA